MPAHRSPASRNDTTAFPSRRSSASCWGPWPSDRKSATSMRDDCPPDARFG
jgi:hypothetical protein